MANQSVGSAYLTIVPKMASNAKDEIASGLGGSGSLSAADTAGQSVGSSMMAGVKKLFGAAAIASVAASAVSAVKNVFSSAFTDYADYEQLTGGVETLFKDSADTVQQYAANAYKTAGLSANDYMETVTGFSASLLQSLNGDTEAAAQVANVAITDMSDNANKMGTSMESIQNAYQGFAKQNYTMLDNLKLGYGGTKEEMERLLEDASAISGIDYDISSYSDIVEAIHVIQTEMGITGTTSEEAATTIQGSVASMQSAWTNWLTGLGNADADMATLTAQLAESLRTALQNVLGTAGTIFESLVTVLQNDLPSLIERLVAFLVQEAPIFVNGIVSLITALVGSLATILQPIVQSIPTIVTTLITAITTNLPALIQGLVDVVVMLVKNLPTILMSLINALPSVIANIASALYECVPELVNGAVDMVLFIVDNLPAIIEALIDAIPQIVTKIADAFSSSDMLSKLGQAGKNLIEGLWQGIKDMGSWIWDKVSGWVNSNLIGPLKDLLGIASPSKLFRSYGNYLVEGLNLGIEDGAPSTYKRINSYASGINRSFTTASRTRSGLGTSYSFGNVTLEVSKLKDAATIEDVAKVFAKASGRAVRI